MNNLALLLILNLLLFQLEETTENINLLGDPRMKEEQLPGTTVGSQGPSADSISLYQAHFIYTVKDTPCSKSLSY